MYTLVRKDQEDLYQHNYGGAWMNAFKITTIIAFSLFLGQQALATDPSQMDQDYQLRLSEQRVKELVSNVQAWKDSNIGRQIAGRTSEDERWSNEWNTLMDDESDKDYLKMSVEL
tara:strand:+ start:46286 stop:46630 length:345 start_codon:yes stop_codon:yes gene_type:complete